MSLRHEQDLDLRAFGVTFDQFSLESALYTEGHVQSVVDRLVANRSAYEQDGALWLRSTDHGDDKDRVMRKTDGGYTYFVPDVAYHEQKFLRGFHKAINIQGSDHHGTIARVRAGLQALNVGIPKGFPDYVLHKMVTVMRGGQEVKISKRAGSYVTLRDLIQWSGEIRDESGESQGFDEQRGRDAVRFFLISRKADSEFVFDVDLALSRSDENPVYYIQYAHARICSVLSQAGMTMAQAMTWGQSFGPQDLAERLSTLIERQETDLMARLSDYPALLAQLAQELAPHGLAYYLRDLAADLHGFYNAQRILVDDPLVREARLLLLLATAGVMRSGLGILGVSSPERM
jgi:arginyl-tRNA synthetase